MTRLFFAYLIIFWPCAVLAAEPFARASIESSGAIVPGQQVRMDIDILVPDFFTSPPQLPLFEVPNALVTLPEERAENISETMAGTSYSGIRKAYAIIPQTTGAFTTPPITIDFGYALDGKPTKASVTVPSVAFNVTLPASAGASSVSFAADRLVMTQSFDRDLRSITVGDAVVRTITISAQATQAIVMPAADVGTAVGLHQYAKAPRIEDGLSDGRNAISRRTETYVYTADTSGGFTIPPVAYQWFDLTDRQIKTATLPAVRLSIAAADHQTAIKPVVNQAATDSPWIRRRKIAAVILAGLALLAAGYAARGVPSALVKAIAEARVRRATSFARRLKLLRQTIAAGKEKDIYRELHAWSRSLGYRTLEEWADRGSDELKREIGVLSEMLFGPGRLQLDRKVLAASLDIGRSARYSAKSALPPLNPSFAIVDTAPISTLPSLVTVAQRAS